MAGLLNTAVSGLQVSQTALKTTGHNIANANTEGYSRQRVEVATNPAMLTGAGFIGNGATVTSVERVVNEFLVEQLRTDTSLNSELSTFSEQIQQLNSLLADPSTGLSEGLSNFFAVLQNAADDPTSIPARQLLVSEADNLAKRFNNLYDRIDGLNSGINQKLDATISRINTLAASVAELNNKIAAVSDGSSSPNDLLDQREETLRELSELVKIDVVDQGQGLLNVSFGSGQALVVGAEVRSLALADGVENAALKDIVYQERSGNQVITGFVEGGELGGLLEFRDASLGSALNELGRVALVLGDAFNSSHARGIDLNNQFGGLFFNDVNAESATLARVQSSSLNAPPLDRVLSLEIVDSSQLSASDYRVEVSSGDSRYSITRASDGEEVYSGSLPASLPQSVEFDGLRLNFISGSFQPGDQFLLQPTRDAARDFTSVLERPDQVALASPVQSEADLGNTGNASISAGALLRLEGADGQALPLFATQGQMDPPLLVQFTSPTRYDILDNSDPGNPVQLDPPIRNRPYVAGQSNALFGSDPGESLVAAAGTALGIGAVSSGASPLAAPANGYPAEVYVLRHTDPQSGAVIQQAVNTTADSSARALAEQLADVAGVSAYPRNSLNIGGFAGLSGAAPLQIQLNGVDLIGYQGGAPDTAVPDPAADPAAFNAYLAERINANSQLQALGIHAVAGTDTSTGLPQLRVTSDLGDDLTVHLEAAAGDSLGVSDYNGSAQTLAGAGAGNQAAVTVGGTLDVVLAADYELLSNPTQSAIFGDSSSADFARASYLGIEASIDGVADGGDQFTLDFNLDGVLDNRNGLALAALATSRLLDSGSSSLGDAYGTLVERVGIEASAADTNLSASEQVLNQTEQLRQSVSGVNLDEEAANLIQFEQIYNANAQVIAVARQLFDRLIGIF